MPFHLTINDEHQFARVDFFGLCTTEDFQSWTQAYVENDRFSVHQSQFLNFNGVTKFDLSFSSFSCLVHFQRRRFKALAPHAVCVILASEDLHFGMARMYQQIADSVLPINVHVERGLEDALALLEPKFIPKGTREQVLA